MGYTQRLGAVEDAAGETKGILVEWEEVRIADSCAQTLLKVQTMSDAIRKLPDGETERHHACPDQGRDANLELIAETRYGRLLINTEMYPCLKRARLPHGSNTPRPNRGNADQRARTEKLIDAIGKSLGKEKGAMRHGKIENIIGDAAKHYGLTRKQYK